MKLSHAIKDIVEVIPEYPNLDQSEKDWLLQQYIFNYKRGVKSIQPDIFTNEKNITYQDISERVNSYPEVKLSDTEFLKKLAREEVDSLDAILDESTSQEDFVYEVYEENFMDRVPHKINKGNIPKSLEQYDIAILLQEAFSQGVISNLDTLAKQFIVNYARKMLKKARSNLAVAKVVEQEDINPGGKWYQAMSI